MSRDSETVSKNMRSIHSKDTSIELQLRKALWHKGYRYRKNYKALPGSPDIVLTKYKIAIVLALGIGKVKDKNRRKQDMDDTLKRAKTKVSKND